MKKSIKVLLILLCFVFLGIFAISGYQLISTLNQYKQAENAYNDVNDRFVTEKQPVPTEKPAENQPPAPSPTPDIEHSPISVNFETLLQENSDVRGWLYLPGTVLNYPLVQARDNDFYLERMWNGEWNPNGSLFLDYRCAPNFTNHNTIIYGHNMNDGSMLHCIREYVEQSYYDEHPYMFMNTPDGNYRVEIFSGYICDAESDTYTIEFYDTPSYEAYLDKICRQSNFNCDITPSVTDRIITLSTCTYEYDTARYVLHGRLVSIDLD